MSDPFIGEIIMFGGNFAPRGWAFCSGQLLDIASHSALFSILGTTYGGDGRTSFGLPDLRGRVPIHEGDGPGLSPYRLGQRGGRETVTLTQAEMPTHHHGIQSGGGGGGGTADLKAFQGGGDTSDPAQANAVASGLPAGLSLTPLLSTQGNAVISDAVVNISAGGVPNSTQNAGSGQPVGNVQPYTTVNFIIALEGVFPPRS